MGATLSGALAEDELDAFSLHDGVQGFGHVLVLAGGHVVRAPDDDRDAAPHPVVELGHLEPYVAAPDHREALRKLRLLQPVPRVYEVDRVETFDGRKKCPRAGVEDDLTG